MFEAICLPHAWKVTGLIVGSQITHALFSVIFTESKNQAIAIEYYLYVSGLNLKNMFTIGEINFKIH